MQTVVPEYLLDIDWLRTLVVRGLDVLCCHVHSLVR